MKVGGSEYKCTQKTLYGTCGGLEFQTPKMLPEAPFVAIK